MKLYFTPGACSLAPHIILRETGIVAELVQIDLATKKTKAGIDFTTINPNGYVPALELDDGSLLTEGPAIVQYLADRAPEKQLAPANGSLARYQLQSLLNFISTELHKTVGALFNPALNEGWRNSVLGLLKRRMTHIESLLAKGQGQGPYLMGAQFTVADAYLYNILTWFKPLGLDLTPWPLIGEYMTRIAARPAVQEALRVEGML